MAVLLTDSPVTDNQGPWYLAVAVTCPYCARVYRLTDEDFKAGLVANIGATGTRTLGWRQVVEGAPTTAAVDSANLHIDPAQIVGQCPWCHYWPITVQGPRYGQTKQTLSTDPTASSVQGYTAGPNPATQVAFHLTNSGVLVGVFLKTDSHPFGIDALGLNVTAIIRTSPTTLNAAYIFNMATPGRRVSAIEARALDSDLCNYLTRFGLTLI